MAASSRSLATCSTILDQIPEEHCYDIITIMLQINHNIFYLEMHQYIKAIFPTIVIGHRIGGEI